MEISWTAQRQLDEVGYTIIPNVLAPDEIDVYRIQLLELSAVEQSNGLANIHTQGKGQLVRWLVNKGELFERLVVHSQITPYFEYMLGADYTLSTLTSNIIFPGAADGAYHVDHALSVMPEPLPSFPLFVNTLWLLDDFSAANGGTRLVPGSHHFLAKPPSDLTDHPDSVRLDAPKGSVLLFNGAVWHSAGANTTERERICLICFCCRSFIKPMFDFVHYLKPEVLARATATQKRRYGFESQPKPPDDLQPREVK